MSKVITVGATALFACVLCATPLSLRVSPEGTVALSADSASARIGRPLTATSVAGVNRRVHRRAYRRGYYGTSAYYSPYRYGYGTYQPYGYASRPYGYGGYASQQYGYGGYASRPYNRYYGYQQPYSGYGNRQWWQF
jgi:hypothetical protein